MSPAQSGVQTILFPLRGTIEERFRRFHQAKPNVYDVLLRLARQALAAGERRGVQQPRLGIRLLWERMRWELWVDTDEQLPKLNDHYISRYARLLVEQHAELEGLFEFRELRAP